MALTGCSARRYSDFYKIKSDYLLYGILDKDTKVLEQLEGATFQKIALLQLDLLWQKLDSGEAIIDEDVT